MIDDKAAAAARAVASELAPQYGPRLAADVEAAIQAGAAQQDQEPPPSAQYVDPVALGALIVAITQFGYQIYHDRKRDGQEPAQEEIARAVRIERRRHSNLPGEETEIIDIVSAKIIEHGGELHENAEPGDMRPVAQPPTFRTSRSYSAERMRLCPARPCFPDLGWSGRSVGPGTRPDLLTG